MIEWQFYVLLLRLKLDMDDTKGWLNFKAILQNQMYIVQFKQFMLLSYGEAHRNIRCIYYGQY